MAFPSLRFRRNLRLVLGCLLLASGAFGTVYAIQATLGQRTYLRAKYGFFRGTSLETPRSTNAMEVVRLARDGMSRYAYNYYLPAYAASVCLDDAVAAYDELEALDEMDEADIILAGMTPEEAAERRARLETLCTDLVGNALYFSKEAVALNPYDEESRLARAYSLLSNGQAEEAVEFWRPIVDREYWIPRHHDVWAQVLLAEGSHSNLVLASREWCLVQDAGLRRDLQRLGRDLSASGPDGTPKGN